MLLYAFAMLVWMAKCTGYQPYCGMFPADENLIVT
jgi:mitochondrial fission protein ELM1